MSDNFLYDEQMDAVQHMRNGCILNGDVGSGKSRTGLYYYFKEQGGSIISDYSSYKRMTNPKDLYVITTAMKRDSLDWDGELSLYKLSRHPELNEYDNKVIVDSWNNIEKYIDISNAFFIFDEDRVTGKGAWVKSFYKIAKKNDWIILSATPGDTWEQYIPVFIANGFYRNKTDFADQHIVWDPHSTYPKINRYLNTTRLVRLRDRILVNMDDRRITVPHHNDIFAEYDRDIYKRAIKERWDIYKDEPIAQASVLCYVLRRITNENQSRANIVLDIAKEKEKVIVFYSFDYERDILLNLYDSVLKDLGFSFGEWSGHKHQPIPETSKWIYIVNYTAGAEGWNCIKTDTIIFYSQQYSFKVLTQAEGRINRLNTPFKDLYYYHIKSRAPIDTAISKALSGKKMFNEQKFYNLLDTKPKTKQNYIDRFKEN